jgi:hypothetical protein
MIDNNNGWLSFIGIVILGIGGAIAGLLVVNHYPLKL